MVKIIKKIVIKYSQHAPVFVIFFICDANFIIYVPKAPATAFDFDFFFIALLSTGFPFFLFFKICSLSTLGAKNKYYMRVLHIYSYIILYVLYYIQMKNWYMIKFRLCISVPCLAALQNQQPSQSQYLPHVSLQSPLETYFYTPESIQNMLIRVPTMLTAFCILSFFCWFRVVVVAIVSCFVYGKKCLYSIPFWYILAYRWHTNIFDYICVVCMQIYMFESICSYVCCVPMKAKKGAKVER